MPRDNVAFKFLPFSLKQKKLLTWWTPKSPYHDFDMIIAEGSIRSGKTISMIDSFFTWSLHQFSGYNFIIAGKSMGALVRNVVEPAFQILRAKGIDFKYHRADHYIEIGSNNYYLFGANTEVSQDVLQGLTAAGAYADEVALMPKSFVDQMVGRCSVEGAKIFFNCNPEGPYHWFKTEFIDKSREKRILHLHFSLDDNLALSESTKARYRRMFSGLFYKRYILGLWVMAEGIIYDMFREDQHTYQINPTHFDRRYIAIDYGTANPCVFLKIGEVDGHYYIYDEYYFDSRSAGYQKTDRQYKHDLITFIGDEHINDLVVDPSALSFITELKDKESGQINARIIEADNDVLSGIANTGGAISQGIVHIHKKCSNLLREFGSYLWDEKAQERGEDKPLKKFDHALDALRYIMRYLLHHESPKIRVRKTSYEELLGTNASGFDLDSLGY